MTIERLRQRATLLQLVRSFFDSRGYFEVETPLLSHETCIDLWLDPFELEVAGDRCYLQTSPEFAMKRLLVSRADLIYQICKAFRTGEQGIAHNPEFTMLEWYRTGDSLSDQIRFVEELVRHVLQTSIDAGWVSKNVLPTAFHRLTYEAAFLRFAGCSALESTDQALREVAEKTSHSDLGTASRDDLLNFILASMIEPKFEGDGSGVPL